MSFAAPSPSATVRPNPRGPHREDASLRRLADEAGAAEDWQPERVRCALRGIAAALAGRSLPKALGGPANGAMWKPLLPPDAPATLPGDLYERLRTLAPGGHRATGCYFTPPPLVDLLVDEALGPVIAEREGASAPCEALAELRVLDPACGSGRFLIAAGERIAAALVRNGMSAKRARRTAFGRCVRGIDIDPIAAEAACMALWIAGAPASEAKRAVRNADALAQNTCAKYDVILGNPPFINGIEGGMTPEARAALRERFPNVRGAADLSYYFFADAMRHVGDGGRVGLLMPRPFLNSPAAEELRAKLPGEMAPRLLYAPDRSRLFKEALVFAAAVVVGPEGPCRVSRDPDLSRADWKCGRVSNSNWWAGLNGILTPRPRRLRAQATEPLGNHLTVVAGMTTGEAYDVRPFIHDVRKGDEPKLITTGLIDPRVCFWGERPCRYLKADYAHPRLVLPPEARAKFRRRLEFAARPKILVAGLTKRVEAFLDARGECAGAVSTFALLDPDDDVERLEHVLGWLLGEEADHLFRTTLGGNSVGGGDAVMKKRWLAELLVPVGVFEPAPLGTAAILPP